MSQYAKFLKEWLTKKRKLKEDEIVMLSNECCTIIQRKLPPKLKDLGSFTIPCTISYLTTKKALCDLGDSVNLMPVYIFHKLGIEEVELTMISLQLADRSIKHPYSILEDILVKVDKFNFDRVLSYVIFVCFLYNFESLLCRFYQLLCEF